MRGGKAASAVGLLVAGLAGCNHDPLVFVPPTDAAMGDAADGPIMSSTPCRTHQILSVPLTDIEVPAGSEARVRSALMVRVSYLLRQGCDVPGDLNVRVMPGNATDFVVVTMRTWRGDRECGPAVSGSRIFWLDEGMGVTNQNLLISDGAPGGRQMLHVTLMAAPQATCNAGLPIGERCNADCECAEGRCAWRAGVYVCGAPCAEDADCATRKDGRNSCGSGVRSFGLCERCADGCCAVPECPFGQQCAAGYCTPRGGVKGVDAAAFPQRMEVDFVRVYRRASP